MRVVVLNLRGFDFVPCLRGFVPNLREFVLNLMVLLLITILEGVAPVSERFVALLKKSSYDPHQKY